MNTFTEKYWKNDWELTDYERKLKKEILKWEFINEESNTTNRDSCK